MLTKFAKKLMTQSGNLGNIPQIPLQTLTTYPTTVKAKDYNGNDFYTVPFVVNGGLSYCNLSGTSVGDVGVHFGTGTTAPTEDDYNLETPWADNITGVTISNSELSCRYDSEENSYYGYVDYTITNNSENDLTVSEIGRYFFFGTSATQAYGEACILNSSGYRKKMLVDRVVLGTPVTIPANTAGIVRYQTKYSGDVINQD